MEKIQVNNSIVLKEIELTDAENIFNAINSQRKYLGEWLPFVEFTKKIEDSETFIKSLLNAPKESKVPAYVIFYKNNFAGLAGFVRPDKENRKIEIGYWLSENFQKKGIMTKCVKTLINRAFKDLEMNRVQIKCGEDNIPSINVAKRTGLKLEGIERDGELFPDGKFINLEIYSILKKEWQKNIKL